MTRRGQGRGGPLAFFAGAAVAAVALLLALSARKTRPPVAQAAADPAAINQLERPIWTDGLPAAGPSTPAVAVDSGPSAAETLLAAFRQKLAARASFDEIAALLDRLAVENPSAVVAAVDEAARSGCDALSDILQAATEALIKTGHVGVALQAADSWATGPWHGSVTNAVFEDISSRLAQDSLPNALGWLRTLPASEGRNYALGSLAATWTATDPAAAMNWAMALLPADGRAEVMQRVFNRWSNEDAVVAAQWLSSHGSDPAADRLITEFIGDSPLLQASPRLAATWAESISDPALRQSTLASVILPWGRQDIAAASNYLTTDSLLPDDQKKQYLEMLRSF